MSSLHGRKLGQYEIVEMLNKGGMGTVYKGYQASIDRYVAIKVLPPHPGMDEQYLQRFHLEAKTIGALQHPHILPLYDYGSQDDILYLVMAYADGGSVEDLIEHAPLQLGVVEKLIRQIAAALDYAHRRGIVHRDIKPGNILLDSEGNALLADFGIVKMLGSGANLTGTGIVGTPAYMSPEQAQGSEIDGRSDVYALGAMTFEMLTGKQPYSGDTPMKVLLNHINSPIPMLLEYNPMLPLELQRVIKRALAKEPESRYQSAGDFADALSKAIHASTDSLEAVREQYPLESTAVMPPLTETGTGINTAVSGTNPFGTGTNPSTVIIRESTSPYVLLGGFALLAAVIVITAVLVISQMNRDTPLPAVTSTAIAEVPISPAATIQAVVPVTGTGELRFNSVNSPGDSLTLRLTRLKELPSGQRYVAWLYHTEDETRLLIGDVVKDAFGDGTLLYTHFERRMLPAWYNAVEITVESEPVEAPAGEIVYSGSVPAAVMDSLHVIFAVSEQGFDNAGLLASAGIEADFAAQHSGLAARATTAGGMKLHAEHTINILRGTSDDLDGNGRGENPGRGAGVYVFFSAIEEAIQTAATAPGATLEVQSNAELIRVCVQNARQWADQVQQLEAQMLASDTLEAVSGQAQESTEKMSHLLNGFDANKNGQIEAFEGECGLAQIPAFGVLSGNIIVQEGNIHAE